MVSGNAANGSDVAMTRAACATFLRSGRQAEARAMLPKPRSRAVIRILLIDPKPLTADAVRRFLESAAGPADALRFEVSAVAAPEQVPEDPPFDVLLLNVSPASDMSAAIEACLTAIPPSHRAVPTVVFSDCVGVDEIAAAVRGGARGYLPSTLDSGEIVEALRLLASGLAVLPPEALVRLAGASGGRAPAAACQAVGALTPGATAGVTAGVTAREREVLQGLRNGKSNKMIARELGMSLSTVKVHVRSLLRKLGVSNRTEAALAAAQIKSPRTVDV